jgi:CubicO group peptidase (beta-lactamase class C family)
MKKINFSLLFLVEIIFCFSLFGQTKPVFDKLDNSLESQFGNKFSYSVLIADNDTILFNKNYGYINTSNKIKTDGNTLYHIASIVKSITAVGIFKLIEEKKINLSDSISKFFNNVPSDKRSITIAALLCHKSGFGQNYVNSGIGNSGEASNALLNDSLISLSGTEFHYSNQNYELLALIIERVTGLKYEDYISKIILNPLNMTNTFFWDEVKNNKNVADIEGEFDDTLLNRNWDYIGSGGIYSTPGDLYKFILGVTEYRVLSSQTTETMLTEQFKTSSGIGICYGWFKSDSTNWGSSEIWTRGSESWGHNAVIRWFPEKESVIIVCTNSGEIGEKQTTGNRIVSDYIADFLWK